MSPAEVRNRLILSQHIPLNILACNHSMLAVHNRSSPLILNNQRKGMASPHTASSSRSLDKLRILNDKLAAHMVMFDCKEGYKATLFYTILAIVPVHPPCILPVSRTFLFCVVARFRSESASKPTDIDSNTFRLY